MQRLLWALRGGGGNFGVATRLDFRLHALDGVVGGQLTYTGKGVREGLRYFRDVVAGSLHATSVAKPGSSVDESLTPALWIAPCYGLDSRPRGGLRTLRSAPGLVDDGVRAHTFFDQQSLFDSPYGGSRHYWKGHFVQELPDELIEVLLEGLVALGRPPGGFLIESLRGAPKDTDGSLRPWSGFRDAAFNLSAMATWDDPALDDQYIAWARDMAAAMEPWSFSGGGYVNYMQADEPIGSASGPDFGAEGLRAAPRPEESGTTRTTCCAATRTSTSLVREQRHTGPGRGRAEPHG